MSKTGEIEAGAIGPLRVRRRTGRRPAVAAVPFLLLLSLLLCLPAPASAEDLHDPALDPPVSLSLTGWGWCLSYADVANVSLNLDGSLLPRAGDEEISDLYLTGTLQFDLPDRTDNFALELRGTKVRSLFFLKQVSGGAQPLIAEFDGTWLEETNYVSCEGVVAVPKPDFVAIPYLLVLRTRDSSVPDREPGGGWAGDWEFIIQKGTKAFDSIADELARGSAAMKDQLGDLLTRVAVLVREVRRLGTPYFT